jgi:argininosuccinate lyase
MAEQVTKQKLWGGRFTGKTDPLMHAFNQSLSYDKRMNLVDIRGSIAYTKALGLSGIITQDEVEKIVVGLEKIAEEWKSGVVSRFIASLRRIPICRLTILLNVVQDRGR